MNRIRPCSILAAAALSLACPIAAAQNLPPPKLEIAEFVNDATGHYTYSLIPRSSLPGPGWRYTGFSLFGFRPNETAPAAANAAPACRFHTVPPNDSIFITADAAECDFLRTHN